MLQEFPKIDFAVVGEPTGMNMAIAERGLMVIDATVTGKSGHAAREEGENAIYKALNAIKWFRDYRFDKVSPLLGPVKMTVTQINGGIQHNMIPDKCTFVVDVRSNELYTNEEILEIIRENVHCRITSFCSTLFYCHTVGPSHCKKSAANETCVIRFSNAFRSGINAISER